MPCYSPLKGWKDDDTGGIKFRPDGAREKMEVACGQCLGCRLDHSRMWAMRIVHEASLWEGERGNCFVTLTYREKYECDEEQFRNGYHVPDDWSLNKAHFQKFMKRLRKHFGGKIRFFHCGEYGNKCQHGLDLSLVKCPMCNVGRPHYHACLFNCGFLDLEPYDSHNGELRYTSPTLEKIWKYGFVDVGALNFESAAYVARYVMKKITGVKADDWYLLKEDGVYAQPEYITMSRRPGIAKEWFDKYKDDLFPADNVPVPGKGVINGVPRYYGNLMSELEPEVMEEVKRLRQVFMREHADEFTPARLMDKYKVKKAAIETLSRRI